MSTENEAPARPVVAMTLEEALRSLTRSTAVIVAKDHGKRARCPVDDIDLMAVGLTDLAYTFEVCTCQAVDYDHLVQQLWHRSCFIRRGPS